MKNAATWLKELLPFGNVVISGMVTMIDAVLDDVGERLATGPLAGFKPPTTLDIEMVGAPLSPLAK